METTREEMLLIICESGATDEVIRSLKEAGVTRYTVHQGFLGEGETGRHEGNPIWPGTNTAIFCAIPEGLVQDVVSRLKVIHDSRVGHTLGLKVFDLPVRELL